MCDSKYMIEPNTLEKMKNFITEEKDELCFILDKVEESDKKILRLNLNSMSRGTRKEEGKRASCNFSNKYPNVYLFHTHPFLSRSYPSMDDVIKVLKSKIIMVSVIATRLGIYTIKPTSKSRKIAYNWTDKLRDKFSKDILRIVDEIGIIENDIGYKTGNLRLLNSTEEKEINDIILLLENVSQMEIKFCSWTLLNL
jgi:hypothetical protein